VRDDAALQTVAAAAVASLAERLTRDTAA